MGNNRVLMEYADISLGPKLTDSDFKLNELTKTIAILNWDNIIDQRDCMDLNHTIKMPFSEVSRELKKDVAYSPKIKSGLIRRNDIIMPIKQKNHRALYINWSYEYETMNYVYNTETLIIRPDVNIVLPKMLYYLLNTENVINYINSEAAKETPNRVSCKLLNNLRLEIPPIEKQQEILERLEAINTEQVEIQKKLNNYTKNVCK